MAIDILIPVANPSPDFDRDDYVEVDLTRTVLPEGVPDEALSLYRDNRGVLEPIPFQIDYPFGEAFRPATGVRGGRVLTFYSRGTPRGRDDYSETSTSFRLRDDGKSRPADCDKSLWIDHFYGPGDFTRDRNLARRVVGVKLGNHFERSKGLAVYISLDPYPAPGAPANYTGAVTSVFHQRANQRLGCENILSPLQIESPWPAPSGHARWGQVTRIDFYPLPWEPRHYHGENLLMKDGVERKYTLLYTHVGAHRAIATLASEPFTVRYVGRPFWDVADLHLTCRLYRVISVYPEQEYYTEQLLVRPDACPDISIGFRAHFASFVEIPAPPLETARNEDIPDYWAYWWRWTTSQYPYGLNLGYGFAGDSHIRALKQCGPNITWRMQLGHEHRCVHSFMYEPHQGFSPYHTIAHDGWYLRLFKPVEMRPVKRYLGH